MSHVSITLQILLQRFEQRPIVPLREAAAASPFSYAAVRKSISRGKPYFPSHKVSGSKRRIVNVSELATALDQLTAGINTATEGETRKPGRPRKLSGVIDNQPSN